MEIKYKQFIILNESLEMSIGKSCAMTAHASYLALREQEKKGKTIINKWLKNGECVIVLEAKTSTQMLGLQQYFNRKKIINHLYIDEGLTEVEMGEPTCLATGILTEEQSEFLSTMELFGYDGFEEKSDEEIEKEAISKQKKIHPIFDDEPAYICPKCGFKHKLILCAVCFCGHDIQGELMNNKEEENILVKMFREHPDWFISKR